MFARLLLGDHVPIDTFDIEWRRSRQRSSAESVVDDPDKFAAPDRGGGRGIVIWCSSAGDPVNAISPAVRSSPDSWRYRST